jgi:DNA-binding winged helix-turn-helix (wHTH) protein
MRMSTLSDDESYAVFRFGEFRFDCASHLLLKNGEEQRLSPKARQLLRMLLLARPKAVSREEIYDALWPATFVCETNMTNVVSELRRVLGDDARAAQSIRTVHGFGYAFAADVETGHSPSGPMAMLRCERQSHLLCAGENSVGRAPDCRIILTDATVSRHHAVIIITGSTFVIEDLRSTNGTYVNGQKISQSRIRQHDALAFGAVEAKISRGTTATDTFPLYMPDDAGNGPA